MDANSLLRVTSEIEVINNKKVVIIFFSGKITSDNIFDLNTKIKNIFAEGIYNVIIHLTNLEYINSTGIAMLLTIARTVEKNQGKLVLTQPSSFVKDLFDMTDIETRFEIVENLLNAREKF